VFKRLFWLTLGFGSGLGTSWYLIRSVKKTVRRTVATYAPAELATRAGDGMRDLRASARAALAEGHAAMREREAELRARVESHRVGASLHPPGAGAAAASEVPAVPPTPGGGAGVAPDTGEVADELAARRNRVVTQAAGRARSGR
jgi:hypothetical protein